MYPDIFLTDNISKIVPLFLEGSRTRYYQYIVKVTPNSATGAMAACQYGRQILRVLTLDTKRIS